MTICSVCDGQNFDNINGFYYCQECGTQSMNLRDLDLSDDDANHMGKNLVERKSMSNSTTKKAKIMQRDEDFEKEKNIEANYSTIHVFNHLLRRQSDDLIELGCDPIIKKVVLELWVKYLQKLKMAFLPNNEIKLNSKNIKYERDKKYFEVYNLHKEATFIIDPKLEEVEVIKMEPFIDNNPESEEEKSSDESIQNDENPENEEEEINTDSKKDNVLLTKFEFIRMPHTITLLNLALLIIKSPILVTNLMKLVYDVKVAYFNIDTVLPESMKFIYCQDFIMFNLHSLPDADTLRYLTGKLGQFLGLNEITLIPMRQITSRFILDLNFPRLLNGVIHLLLEKVEPRTTLNLKKAEYENLEAQALSYIFVACFVLFQFDNKMTEEEKEGRSDLFLFDEWIQVMQNCLNKAEIEIVGKNSGEANTMKDLLSFKERSFKHRYKLNSNKNYIANYRNKSIQDSLKSPLETNQELKDLEAANFSNSEKSTNSSLLRNLSILNPHKKETLKSFVDFSMNEYLSQEKLRILSDKDYRSQSFSSFSRRTFNNNETKSRYLLGLQTSTNDWIIDKFAEMSQSKNYFKMLNHVSNLLNELI